MRTARGASPHILEPFCFISFFPTAQLVTSSHLKSPFSFLFCSFGGDDEEKVRRLFLVFNLFLGPRNALTTLIISDLWRHLSRRRAKHDWRDMVTDEDETVLCSFQYELEQGLQRFEEAKAAGELSSWPPRTLHPTQGLPAIGAAYRAAVEEICGGREKLFLTEYRGPGRRGFKMNRNS